MHLAQILDRRAVPAAGLFLMVTRRCPLSCAHCSTASAAGSEQVDGDLLLEFVAGFEPGSAPEFLLLTGGEPLLRPALVERLIERAHRAGTAVSLISGMFFARQNEIPPAIERGLKPLDHFTASLDAFHEREVPRKAVFSALHRLRDRGHDVSLQVTALNADDPYLKEATAAAMEEFDCEVPILVNFVGRSGRAREWLPERDDRSTGAQPCAMAAWPVVGSDGAVVACCNQSAVDGPRPAHLTLGRLPLDWGRIRARLLARETLRAIRVLGPRALATRAGAHLPCDGYCASCLSLEEDEPLRAAAGELMGRKGARWLEARVAERSAESFAASPELSPLLTLGSEHHAAC